MEERADRTRSRTNEESDSQQEAARRRGDEAKQPDFTDYVMQPAAQQKVTDKGRAPTSPSCPVEKFQGSLFLIGGVAESTFSELIALARQPAKVVIVGHAAVIPGYNEVLAEYFCDEKVKADNITIILPEGEDPPDAKRFHYSHELPAQADIVYFGGGWQDKLRDSFGDRHVKQLKLLLQKGTIIAGNSAGAAVMAREMINGGDEKKLEHYRGFGLTPWAIIDTHVNKRHRLARDATAVFAIGHGKLPVIGLDEDTRVRFYFQGDVLKGEIGGAGAAHIFQAEGMPPLKTGRLLTPAKLTVPGEAKKVLQWDLKAGDSYDVDLSALSN